MKPALTPSPALPLTRPRGDAGRERLITAATEAFATKGFHGCTTRDIALAAGLSPAAMYVHYKTKEELLFLISREGHETTLTQVREAVASSSDPAVQLAAMVRGHVHDHAEGHVRARVTNYELANLDPDHYRVVAEMRREIEELFYRVVDEGVRVGVFSTDDPRMTVRALLSIGIDTARWFRDSGPSAPSEISEHYVGLALRMVGVRSGRAGRSRKGSRPQPTEVPPVSS